MRQTACRERLPNVRQFTNRHTGEQVTIVSETPELLTMDVAWPRPGRRAAAHVHPEMEERYEVVSGTAAFRIGEDPERTAGPGETVVVPPGTRHLAWNPTDGEVRLRIEMRPALRWSQFVERLFGGDDPAALLREFTREIRP
jgi:mannose-6-phosphate isomerase-like protein (cupin superfamily)